MHNLEDPLRQLVDEMANNGYSVTIGRSEEHGYEVGLMWSGGMVGGGEDMIASGDTIDSAAARASACSRR